MTNDERRQRVKELARSQAYKHRAYMSSGLTNLSDADRQQLLAQLEELYLDVFHPMDVFLYLPHLWSDPGHNSQMSAADVHVLDRLRIAEADFLVLCGDYPSFGAGQEFEIAQATGLRVLLYHHESTRVSRMLLGGAGLHGLTGAASPEAPVIVRYRDFADLKDQLAIRANEICATVGTRLSQVPVPNFSARLQQLMARERWTVERLATETGFTPQFIRYLLSTNAGLKRVLERWDLPQFPVALDITKYINPGLWVIRVICRAMGVDVSELVMPEVTASEAQRRAVTEKLTTIGRKVALSRGITLQTWDRFVDRIDAQDAVAARSPSDRDLERYCNELFDQLQRQ